MGLSFLKVLSKSNVAASQTTKQQQEQKAFLKKSFEYKLHIIIHDNWSYFVICQFQSVLSIGGVVVWTVFLGTFQGSDLGCDDNQKHYYDHQSIMIIKIILLANAMSQW